MPPKKLAVAWNITLLQQAASERISPFSLLHLKHAVEATLRMEICVAWKIHCAVETNMAWKRFFERVCVYSKQLDSCRLHNYNDSD